MTEFARVRSREQILEVVDLAREIWTDHYIPIIGQEQVDYMFCLQVAEKRATVFSVNERVTPTREEQRKDQRKPLNNLLGHRYRNRYRDRDRKEEGTLMALGHERLDVCQKAASFCWRKL